MKIFRKKDDYVDLSNHLRRQEELRDNFNQPSSNEEKPVESPGFFGGFFERKREENGAIPTVVSTPSTTTPGDRKRKLAQRILDMTNKIESLEKDVRSLKERVEYLERKDRGY